MGAIYSATLHRLRVLAYHRVLPRVDEDRFPYDIELVSAWQEEFDWQARFLAGNYEVITCRDLAGLLDAGHPVPRRAVIISFDDGYRDNHDIVLPILKQYRLPAVVFVATGYMDASETYWYDQFVNDLLRAKVSHLPLGEGVLELDIRGGPAARRNAAVRALSHLKSLSDHARQMTLIRWRDLMAVESPGACSGLDGPMSWLQVKALSDAGVEIGSHTVTHPVLARLTDSAQLENELFESKMQIEAHTGKSVVALAYPVGGPEAYNDRVIEVARRAGYRFGFSYQSGAIDPAHLDSFRLRRLAVERYVSRERFRALLAVPTLFA